jgi:neutral amino acid transport system permease protein
LAAIGISLIFGTTGFSNFAHGEMVTLGALLTWLLYSIIGLPIVVAGAITIALTAGFGWLQDAAIWRPLRNRRLGLNQTMIVSIGFSIVLRYVLLMIFGGDTKDLGGTSNSVTLGPVVTNTSALASMAISAVALIGVAFFLTRTRVGKATRAVSDNASLAASTGIDVERIIRIVWLLAAALTGLSGILYGLQFQANWSTGFSILLLLFASTTLGGLGTSFGTAIGALIIGVVVQTSVIIIPTDLSYASALVVLILTLLFRPQGILGKKQRLG